MKQNDPDSDDLRVDDVLLGRLLQDVKPIELPAEPAANLRQRVMDRIHGQAQGLSEDLLTVRATEGQWMSIAALVTMKLLYVDHASQTRSFLLRLEPGARLPAHEHSTDEECMVLEGEVILGDVTVRAGDYHLAPKGVPHGEVVSRTGALLFLRAGF